jgi:hypothetical protein
MPARTGRKHRRGTEAKRLEVAAHLVAELDGEGAVRGISCGLMADYVIELGLRALRTQKSTQESLMASSNASSDRSPVAVFTSLIAPGTTPVGDQGLPGYQPGRSSPIQGFCMS